LESPGTQRPPTKEDGFFFFKNNEETQGTRKNGMNPKKKPPKHYWGRDRGANPQGGEWGIQKRGERGPLPHEEEKKTENQTAAGPGCKPPTYKKENQKLVDKLPNQTRKGGKDPPRLQRGCFPTKNTKKKKGGRRGGPLQMVSRATRGEGERGRVPGKNRKRGLLCCGVWGGGGGGGAKKKTLIPATVRNRGNDRKKNGAKHTGHKPLAVGNKKGKTG